jgi:hypothetical protein
VSITEPGVRCGTGGGSGGCDLPEGGCAVFALAYHDLAAVSDGELLFSVRSDGCFTGPDAAGGADPGGEPFRAGRFTGWVIEHPTETSGVVSAGGTTVSFATELPAEDARAVLATLVPFDAANEPAVLTGVPSS